MFEKIKFFIKTSILKEVVYNRKGLPIDCKGLQIIKGKPFEEGTTYKISSEWKEYTYLGEGKYLRKGIGFALRTDMKNPYYSKKLRESKERFGSKYIYRRVKC